MQLSLAKQGPAHLVILNNTELYWTRRQLGSITSCSGDLEFRSRHGDWPSWLSFSLFSQSLQANGGIMSWIRLPCLENLSDSLFTNYRISNIESITEQCKENNVLNSKRRTRVSKVSCLRYLFQISWHIEVKLMLKSLPRTSIEGVRKITGSYTRQNVKPLTLISMYMSIMFWDVTPYSLIQDQRFGGTDFPHPQSIKMSQATARTKHQSTHVLCLWKFDLHFI
jgi:hypothetical protein